MIVQVYSIWWWQWWWKEMKPVEDARKEWLHASLTNFKLQIPLHNWFWPAHRLLQDVSGKNTELPVESLVASCRRLNYDQTMPKPWKRWVFVEGVLVRSPGGMVGTLILELRGLLFCMEYLQTALIVKSWACFPVFASFFSVFFFSVCFFLFFFFFFFKNNRGPSMRFSPLPSPLSTSEGFSPKGFFF